MKRKGKGKKRKEKSQHTRSILGQVLKKQKIKKKIDCSLTSDLAGGGSTGFIMMDSLLPPA